MQNNYAKESHIGFKITDEMLQSALERNPQHREFILSATKKNNALYDYAQMNPQEQKGFLEYSKNHDITPQDFMQTWRNTHYTAGVDPIASAIGGGFAKNLADIAGSVAGAGKVGAGMLGLEGAKEWLEDKQKSANRFAQSQEIAALKHDYQKKFMAAEMIADPLNVVPAGQLSKAKGLLGLAKNIGIGGAFGAGFSAIDNLYRDDISDDNKIANLALGALAGGALQGALGAVVNKLDSGKWLGESAKHPNAINPQDTYKGIEISEVVGDNLPPNPPTPPHTMQGVEGQPNMQGMAQPKVESQTAQGISNYLDENLYPTSKANNAGIEISEQAAQNLPQNQGGMLKGQGFLTENPNINKAVTDYNTPLNLQEWIRNAAGIAPNKQIMADLLELAGKHPEMFDKPSDVYRLLAKVKDEPNHFYHNNNPKVAMIGKDLEGGKLGRIGIQKDYASDYLKVKHAQRIDGKRGQKLLNFGKSPLVEAADSTHPLSVSNSRYMPTGANALSKDKPLAVWSPTSHTPLTDNVAKARLVHKAHSLKDRDIIAKDLEILAKEYPKEFSQYGREITQAIAQNPQVFIKNGRLNLPNIRELMGFIKGQEKPAIAYKGKAQDNLPSELRDSSAHKASTGFLSSTSKDSNKIIPQKLRINQKTLTIPQEVRDIYRVLQGGETTQEEFLKLYKYPLNKFLEKLRKSLNSATTTSGDYGKGKEIYDLLRDSKQLETLKDKILKIPQEYIPREDSKLAYIVGADINNPKEPTYAYAKLLTLKAKNFKDIIANAHILQEIRQTLQKITNIHPNAEFGVNYAEFYRDGQGAIAKILAEAKDYKARKTAGKLTQEELDQGAYKGQVSGAFYRKDLEELSGNGNIDIVWGDSKFGLAHILEKHGDEFKNLADDLSEIIGKGKIVKRAGRENAYNIEFNGFKVGINKGFNGEGNNQWVVTAFDDNFTKAEKNAKTARTDDFTKEVGNLPLNSKNIIPQNATSAKKNLPTQKAESQNLQDTINELHDVSLRYFDKPYKIQTADIGKDRHFIGMAFENPREFKKVYQSTLERIIKTELDRNYPNSYHIALGTGKENGKTYATINIQISKNPTQDTFYKLESQKGKGILERVRDLRLAKEKKEKATLGKVTTYLQREKTKEVLAPIINRPITNKNDGRVAQVSRKNVEKMTSDKSIAKSVDNGFSEAEHFNAVRDIEKLYQNAVLKETHKDIKGQNDAVLIHRYNAKYGDKNALITLKETLSGQYQGNKIYTLELESLELKASVPDPQGKSLSSRNTIRTAIVTPDKDSNKIIPQSSTNAKNPLQVLDKYAPNLADEARLNNLSQDLKDLQTRFKLRNKDKENAKLFDRALIVAQQLGVKVNLNATATKQGALGSFNVKTNTIELFTKNAEKQAETLLHELIHAVTLKALKADEKLLTPLQKEAIKEIKEAYDILSKDPKLKGEYGITNVEEMLAELSNKGFRDKLESKGILRRILDAITGLFFKNKTNKNVKYEDLKNSLYKLMDNYNLEGRSVGDSTHYKLSKEAKEQKGIYNVTYNGKNATLIKRDLESVENAIVLAQGNMHKGAKHIRIRHTKDTGKEGYISDLELVNVGKDLREYLSKYKEPFIDSRGARIYEWFNEKGDKFRLVVDDVADIDWNPNTATGDIITYFSNRNSNKMKSFKNPAVEKAYNEKFSDTFYKLESEFKDKGVFRKLIDTALDKALDNHLIYEGLNKLGVNTYREKDYMALREAILNNNNGSVKAMVDLNNLLNAKFNKEELRELQRYYVGDNYDSKIVTQELKDVADTIKEKINALTEEGIKKGIFPEYYREMKDYLKRGYEKHIFNHKGHLKSSALEFHKTQHRGTSKFVSEAEIQRMHQNGEMAVTQQDYKNGKWIISENVDSRGRREIYRDWTKQEREKMGEIEDFSFNVARTIDTIQKQLYTHDFIKDLEAKAILKKAEGKVPEGYVDSSTEFGIIGNPFKQYYIKAEVAQDLKETFYKMYGDKSDGLKLLKRGVSLWKSFKTIWNPVSHNNSILGNAVFMIASGEYKAAGYLMSNITKSIFGNQVFGKYKKYKEAKLHNKYFNAGLSAEDTKDMQLLEELERRGYFDKSFLNNIVDNYNAKHNGIEKGKQNLLKRFHNWLGNVYNAEDVLARFSLAKSFLEQGMKLEEALNLTSKVLPDYSKPMPYWLKNADRLGALPFIQFTYHATPIIAKQVLGFSHKGGWSRKQATINIAALMAYGLYHTMVQPLPDGYFGSEVQIGRSGDNVRTLRIGSIIPHLQMLEFIPGSSSGIGNYAPEFLRKSAMGNPYMQMLGLAANENYNFGSKITRRSGGLGALDRVGALVDFTTPAPVGKATNMLINETTRDSKNRRSKIHNERSFGESLLGFAGINTKTFNARELENKKRRDLLKGR